MRLLVIQHDHASPLGPVAERFAERGYDATSHLVVPADRFHDPGVETEFPDFTRFDAVVLMGAPWSAYDELVASWVLPERDRLRGADEAGVPVLGICFGGQLLAATLGGAVGPSPQRSRASQPRPYFSSACQKNRNPPAPSSTAQPVATSQTWGGS